MMGIRETEWSEALARLAVVISTYKHVGTTADQVFLACESLWADWDGFEPTGPDWLQGFEESMDEGEMQYAAESFTQVRSLLREKLDHVNVIFENGDDSDLGGLILELTDGIYSLLEGPEAPEKTSESVFIEAEKLLEILLESNGLKFPEDENLSEIDLDQVGDPGEREILRELIAAFEELGEAKNSDYRGTLYPLISRILIVHWSFYRLKVA
ncbi:hypothetical protein EHQ53_09375 [Leptospira langatensis]|uniref:Uncharacterized protein n=1 Tax=Leptospira langatensis TaxID=2484983 RepID=A0A5F1ZXS2_9LEPT|nr:hypothetical protein [Leptospira langatensis]TGK01173.1 hypothetical protein EHO57_09500 [Leptospira langatensis]TGL42375.1 hypothetical protein EHQ53_09375 [Leptospira langatensis]